MERAADPIGVELAQVEGLLDDALASEGGIAVDQDYHPTLPRVITRAILPGPHAADRDGVDELQVARIEAEREVHAPAIGRPVIGRMPEVVFHVTAAHVELRIHVGELAENPLRALAHDVGQHVEPATMGHRQHAVADVLRGGPLDRHLHQRNQALRPLEREALRSEEPLLNELLEDSRRHHLPVNP